MATRLLDSQLSQARAMLANGASLTAIARRIGCDRSTIRKDLHAEYLAVRTANIAKATETRARNAKLGRTERPRSGRVRDSGHVARLTNASTNAEAARLLALIPADTRSLTGRLLNDPLPGRSALDMKRQAGA
jgi:transposase-like protein